MGISGREGSEGAQLLANAGEATRQEKHIVLDRGIDSAISIIEHLQSLVERIGGSRPEEQMPADKPVSSGTLARVLDTAPERIKKIEMEAHELIQEIENILF